MAHEIGRVAAVSDCHDLGPDLRPSIWWPAGSCDSSCDWQQLPLVRVELLKRSMGCEWPRGDKTSILGGRDGMRLEGMGTNAARA